jgi:hypothetical protein
LVTLLNTEQSSDFELKPIYLPSSKLAGIGRAHGALEAGKPLGHFPVLKSTRSGGKGGTSNDVTSKQSTPSSDNKKHPLGDWFNPKSSPYAPERVGKRVEENTKLYPDDIRDLSQDTSVAGPIKAGTVYHPQPIWKSDGLPGILGTVKGLPRQPVSGGSKLRTRWIDKDGNIYDWDSQHGKVEKFDPSGKTHLGEYDPVTGEKTKPADPSRKTRK